MFGLLFASLIVTGCAGSCAGGSCPAGDETSFIQVENLVKSGRGRLPRGDEDEAVGDGDDTADPTDEEEEEMEEEYQRHRRQHKLDIDDVKADKVRRQKLAVEADRLRTIEYRRHKLAVDEDNLRRDEAEEIDAVVQEPVVTSKELTHRYRGPQDSMTCDSPVYTTKCLTKETYDKIVKDISDIVDDLGTHCPIDPGKVGEGVETSSKYKFGKCPQASWTGCVLRMAGHDFMDFDGEQGGSDACTDMDNPDNAGLTECLATGEFGHSLNDVYGPVCEQVSLADFLVIAAEAVMVKARDLAIEAKPDGSPVAPGGYSKLDFSGDFMYGRTTNHEGCSFTEGSLPNPENGCDDVDRVFVKNMGMGDSEFNGTTMKNGMAAALMGVHTLGKAEQRFSGYEGWWSFPEESRQFTNDYYVSMISQGWFPEEVQPGKNQWKKVCGPDRQMMLNTDMCLAFGNRDGEPLHTRDNCCAWVGAPLWTEDHKHLGLTEEAAAYLGTGCNTGVYGHYAKQECCNYGGLNPEGEEAPDCGSNEEGVYKLTGLAADAMMLYASNDEAWISDFKKAWAKATSNGFAGKLHKLEDTCTS